jgi:methylated-DNA-protein-cysteine methyltransferase related protein
MLNVRRALDRAARSLVTINLMAKTKQPNLVYPRIRQAIMNIPRGRVSSYGAIACAAGMPGAARLVVRVLNQSHGLPWHRVVAAGGRIALPGEHGLDQRFRLEMEGVKFSGRKVRMAEFEFKFRAKAKSAKVKKKAAGKKRKS